MWAAIAMPVAGWAEDGLETWIGGAVAGGAVVSDPAGFESADAVTTQAEVNGALGWGWGHARVDLDLHFDLNAADSDDIVGAYPSPYPEWAMVQLGREATHLRLGLLNPNMGLEDWDPWINYTAFYSTNFAYTGAGRFLGGDAGISTGGGVDVFLFGGYDVDWESVGGGAGVATAQDLFSTWSGVTVYPAFEGSYCSLTGADCLNVVAALSFELYPLDPLWIAIDNTTGLRDDAFYASNQLVVNVIPEAVANPYARAELLIDPDDVITAQGAYDATFGAGVRTDAIEWLRVNLEGQARFAGSGYDSLAVGLVVGVHRPEPSPYSYTDPFGEEEEEAAEE